MTDNFRALVLRQTDDESTTANFEMLTTDALPDGEVLVRVTHSSLNYKDGLALTGTGKVVRQFPMVPGIDFAGVVVSSDDSDYQPGDSVILTGWGVGEKHWGGYAEFARVPAAWLVPLPGELSPAQAMAVGTAGLTAMLAVMALEDNGLTPQTGAIVVSGAGGGAGGVAVAILATLGYTVTASTGREYLTGYLKRLGASNVIGRFSPPQRPMASGRWAAAVDGVGGDTLAALLTEIDYGGNVAAYGLAGGHHLETTVFPFILRGVSLLGIDSVMCPFARRRAAWQRVASTLTADTLNTLATTVPLSDVMPLAARILSGDIQGRIVLDVSA